MEHLQGLTKDQLIDMVQQLEAQLNSLVSALVTHGELSRAILHANHIVENLRTEPTKEQIEELCAAIQHAAARIRRQKCPQ
jgi:ribosome-binding factor A